jgi:hypothetical protein
MLGFIGCVSRLSYGEATIINYPAPEGIIGSQDARIFVNDEELFVYETAVNHNRIYEQFPELSSAPVAYFDFEGTVEIKIQAEDVSSAVVRPLSLGIKPVVKDGVISFPLSKPAFLTIEVNGLPKRAIHLFANPLETDIPDFNDPNVIYVGPGIHDRFVVRLRDNQTLYLAGGAVLRSHIISNNGENIRVMGRGIIDGSAFDRWPNAVVPIDFQMCKDASAEGVIILDPAGWTLNTFGCENVTIENVKIISARPNGDGITTQSCKNLTARNCFVRSWDDSLVVKNYGNGVSENILFKDIVIWSDLAQSCEIGYETLGPRMDGITFEDITVLHNFHKPVMSIHNSDQAHIQNVTFRDITVEDAQMGLGDATNDNFLIDLSIAESQWSRS